MKKSVVWLVLLGWSVVACTNEEDLGGRGAAASTDADAGAVGVEGDGGTSTPSRGTSPSGGTVEQYCSARCVEDPGCTTSPRSRCYADLSTEAVLAEVDACAARQVCDWAKCRAPTTARTRYETACKAKVAECGDALGGLSAGDCDDVSPVLRDDVLVPLTTCFDEACGDALRCLAEALKASSPTACADL